MSVTFLYKGTKITTPNLDKKLKRMKITMDDITIVEEEVPKVIQEEPTAIITTYTYISPDKKYKIVTVSPDNIPDDYTFVEKKDYKI